MSLVGFVAMMRRVMQVLHVRAGLNILADLYKLKLAVLLTSIYHDHVEANMPTGLWLRVPRFSTGNFRKFLAPNLIPDSVSEK